ncbi:MAG: YbaN family protein [Chloroflexi bacterium]|nr:YbaN family protein [Chloroflexota bacterium]
MSRIGKSLWVIGGTICIGLAILGILLPVLPTTPFLLLAAFCYGRGSERFYRWLIVRSPFGNYIRNYRDGQGIPLKYKVVTVTLLWLTIGISIGFIVTTWWLKALLAIVAVGVTFHLSRIKTRCQESPNPVNRNNPTKSAEIS